MDPSHTKRHMHIFYFTGTRTSDEILQEKLSFLHHILTLPPDDPVQIAYEEQKMYSGEPNWYNEICSLMKSYGLEMNEQKIQNMSKDKWKEETSSAIRKTVFESLVADCLSKSKTSKLPRYPCYSQQDYFVNLPPKKARMYFQLRAGVYDFKCNRKYMYNDEICRLCNSGEESTDHVINHCDKINRKIGSFGCIYSTSDNETIELLNRVEQFKTLLDKKGDASTQQLEFEQ